MDQGLSMGRGPILFTPMYVHRFSVVLQVFENLCLLGKNWIIQENRQIQSGCGLKIDEYTWGELDRIWGSFPIVNRWSIDRVTACVYIRYKKNYKFHKFHSLSQNFNKVKKNRSFVPPLNTQWLKNSAGRGGVRNYHNGNEVS